MVNISVVVTTYNKPNELIRVLQGLNKQVVLPGEIIVADDGSAEDTRNKINEFAKSTLCKVKHVWHEDKGFRAAGIRNKAIKAAAGDYIVLLDGDCIPDKYFIKDHAELAKKGFFFQGKRVLVEKSKAPQFSCNDIDKRLSLLFSKDISNKHHLLRINLFPAFISNKLKGSISCNMGIFTKDLYAINGFNENFVGWGREDSELVVRLYNYGLKRHLHPFKAVCYHLWHPENKRDNLSANDLLLKQAMESGEYKCEKGLD